MWEWSSGSKTSSGENEFRDRGDWVEGLSGVEVYGERVEGRKGFLGEVKGMG